MAAPISYAVDGVQYVAVLAGYGGAFAPLFVPGSAPLRYQNIERLIIFKLDGGDVPKPPPASPPSADVAASSSVHVDPTMIAKGQTLYLANCARCHSFGPSAGVFPALWPLSRNADDNFDAIVYGGALDYAGMAPFSDLLSRSDVEAIHEFLRAGGMAAVPQGKKAH
jgi:quinohemoprotein ethanol dehydrogenase